MIWHIWHTHTCLIIFVTWHDFEAYLENSKEVEHRGPLEALKQGWFVRMRFKDFFGLQSSFQCVHSCTHPANWSPALTMYTWPTIGDALCLDVSFSCLYTLTCWTACWYLWNLIVGDFTLSLTILPPNSWFAPQTFVVSWLLCWVLVIILLFGSNYHGVWYSLSSNMF